MSEKTANPSKIGLSYFFQNLNMSKDNCPFYKLMCDWLNSARSDGLSAVTIHEYSDKISRFYWWWTVHTKYNSTIGQHPKFVQTSHVKEFAAYLRETNPLRWGIAVPVSLQTLSPATIAGYGRTVKVFFSWLEREDYISQSPINKSVKFTNKANRNTTIKNVSQDNIRRLFAVLTSPEQLSTFAGVRDLAMISLLLDSGIRRGELLSLELSDLDMRNMRFVITGKTGTRTAYFSEKCKGVLLDYLNKRKEISESNWLWITVDGERMGDNSFGSTIRRISIKSGVNFSAHKMRHSFALMMSSKVSTFELMDMLGHSNITTTQIYVRNSPDRLGSIHQTNSPLNTMGETISGLKRKGRPRKYSH
ncbi:MAG: tyrosine-type recombinase/integrase [Chloroflexi bacterium]|mgnify:CR=1 FL=1|nr:tyrosine-type recombinase/integrase [Chloroflexota bacterium]OJW05525.1 MAG: hypothetical protein BGO39_08875 [Chloroflexi bacterium 54-19]